MSAPPIAQVVVNVRTNAQATTYDYAVPPDLGVQMGHLVWVPFGSRRAQGIVFGLGSASEVPEHALKPIEALIAPEPALRPYQVELARWLSTYYCAPLLDAALLMLPPGVRQPGRSLYSLTEVAMLPSLDPVELHVVDYLRRHGEVEEERLRAGLRRVEGAWAAVGRLAQAGALRREWRVPRAAAPRRELYLRLPREADLSAHEGVVGRSEARRRALAALGELLATARRLAGPGAEPELLVPAAELRQRAEVELPTLRQLAEAGVFTLEEREVRRDPSVRRDAPPPVPVALTGDQAAAAAEIEASIGRGGRFLLHGVTGSGKTQVYARAIARALALGRTAFVLVPEIALEPQLAGRLLSLFPGRIALVHSGLSAGERYDEWRRIRDGEADVVVGARSAIFAPLAEPGLIVLDEAHEWTYKQDERPPRYHAREVARRIAALIGATLVLGSATPDVETYERARQGEYRLIELRERVRAPRAATTGTLRLVHPAPPPVPPDPAPLPEVEIVDMREEAASGNRSAFSRRLLAGLRTTLERREQAILFLNRRGTATFVQCHTCGHVVACPRCAISYVYHGEREELLCHQCGRHAALPHRCPVCWQATIGYFGVGTQRVEAEAHDLLPAARILRWDRDTAAGPDAHARFLKLFAEGGADIMIGTQLVAKGLDLPRVTLVGVISADVALHLPDFRAAERTYQLTEQVAGRAGRSDLPGQVILQTYSPDHYAIRAAAHHDYAGFFEAEIAFRREHGYPPAGELVRLLFSHSNEARCRQTTGREADRLRAEVDRLGLPDVDVLGPTPAFRRRARNLYRWQIVLRGADLRPLIETAGLPAEARPPANPNAVTLGWSVDVDPVSLL